MIIMITQRVRYSFQRDLLLTEEVRVQVVEFVQVRQLEGQAKQVDPER